MIELLLAVQTITNLALAIFVIKLRRELWPMTTTAGPADQVLTPLMRVFIRSVNVLVVETPQFEVSKTVIRVRKLFTEELFLKYSLGVYDVAMRSSCRGFYRKWKAWQNGDDRYRCVVEKPRGFLARLYNKAICVICYDMEDEKDRWHWEVIEIATRRRRKKT